MNPFTHRGAFVVASLLGSDSSAFAASAGPVVTLEEFKVSDRQDSAYKAATAITGTKTDTPFIQVPQSIQVITRSHRAARRDSVFRPGHAATPYPPSHGRRTGATQAQR